MIGVDHIDFEAAARRGIPVCNAAEYCIDEVADHTVGFMLPLMRQTVACAVRGEKLPNVMNGVGLRAHSAKLE